MRSRICVTERPNVNRPKAPELSKNRRQPCLNSECDSHSHSNNHNLLRIYVPMRSVGLRVQHDQRDEDPSAEDASPAAEDEEKLFKTRFI